MEYEWDPEKDGINQRLHGVSFAEASTVFLDPLAATVPDERYAMDEFRFRTTGYSLTNRLVIVAHADRGGRIRIISARGVTPAERRQYEQES
ncbi:MAG TPA: BrnT family toxin [Thermoanaerobaculia bacterium]|nr:BrnT family toxin [Thermoanaerobaculia bacterium]